MSAALLAGPTPASAWTPSLEHAGSQPTPEGAGWFDRVSETGVWLEVIGHDGDAPPHDLPVILPILNASLKMDREIFRLSDEIGRRYEEIDLLYTISDILGQTLDVSEAARIILQTVSGVVGAERASILGYDAATGLLRPIATKGFPIDRASEVKVDDTESIAARVFRTREPMVGLPHLPIEPHEQQDRLYRSSAYLSVPICFAGARAADRCVGVINLTDREGGAAFSPGQCKLVEAIANQIGAALENARLVAREREQHRLRGELELARQLQLQLLPSPSELLGDATVAVQCQAVESVGGDFYTFTRLGAGRVGVMVGDVSSHGFSAALVMALVLAAAGIHGQASHTPSQALAAIRESLAGKLSSTETYFSVFYGVVDPERRRLLYANAGHPHAFRIPRQGDPERLEASAPPLGLTGDDPIGQASAQWEEGDLLCLWTDGMVDTANEEGERFGEARLLESLATQRHRPPDEIVAEVMRCTDAFSTTRTDDRTLLILRS